MVPGAQKTGVIAVSMAARIFPRLAGSSVWGFRTIAGLAFAGLAGCGDGTTTGSPAPGLPPPPTLGSWVTQAPMPTARTENSAVALGGLVYLAGGFGVGGGPAPELFVYDPKFNRWETMGNLPRAVNHTGMAAVDGLLYLVGGFGENSFSAIDFLQIFDPATGSFDMGPPLPTPRGALAVTVLDGRIHAIGGLDAQGRDVGTHEVFDPSEGSWSTRAPMPTARDHHGAAAAGGLIYVAAGRVGNVNLSTLEVYDPVADAWSPGPPVPTARSGVAVLTLDEKVYVFGGESLTGGGTFDEAERFDPATNGWDRLTPMPTARHGLGAGAVDGLIYVLGGGPNPGLTFSAVNERFTLE